MHHVFEALKRLSGCHKMTMDQLHAFTLYSSMQLTIISSYQSVDRVIAIIRIEPNRSTRTLSALGADLRTRATGRTVRPLRTVQFRHLDALKMDESVQESISLVSVAA